MWRKLEIESTDDDDDDCGDDDDDDDDCGEDVWCFVT